MGLSLPLNMAGMYQQPPPGYMPPQMPIPTPPKQFFRSAPLTLPLPPPQYHLQQHSTPMKGGRRDGFVAFPTRKALGQELFGSKSKEEVADFFIACLAHREKFRKLHPQACDWRMRDGADVDEMLVQVSWGLGGAATRINLYLLLIQAFILFLDDSNRRHSVPSTAASTATTPAILETANGQSNGVGHSREEMKNRKSRLMRLQKQSSSESNKSTPVADGEPSTRVVGNGSAAAAPVDPAAETSCGIPVFEVNGETPDLAEQQQQPTTPKWPARQPSNRVPITQEQKLRILRHLIEVDFISSGGQEGRSLWFQIFRALAVYKVDHLQTWFIQQVEELALKARAR